MVVEEKIHHPWKMKDRSPMTEWMVGQSSTIEMDDVSWEMMNNDRPGTKIVLLKLPTADEEELD